VDVVCINQLDEHEEEHQIQFMATIYAKARCVIVWLGEAGKNDTALKSIRIAGEAGRNSEDIKSSHFVSSASFSDRGFSGSGYGNKAFF
jgi:hypothetical protein